jgi:hypothetical protein
MSPVTPQSTAPSKPPTTAWDRFWFKPADPTTLGLVRICCGLIVLYTTIAYSFDLFELFGRNAWLDLDTRLHYIRESPMAVPMGTWETTEERFRRLPPPRNEQEAKEIQDYREKWTIDPRMVFDKGTPVWSIWFDVTDPAAMMAVQTFFLLVMLLFTLGCATRITSVLAWFAQLCYIHRAPTALFGVDTMSNIVLLYCMIGPSGAALSVDRLIAHWWRGHRLAVLARWRRFANGVRGLFQLPLREVLAVPATTAPVPWELPAPSASANFAIRLLQIHTCIIYAMAGLSKLQGPSWWSGNAIWFTLANYEFAPMEFLPYKAFLRYLTLNRPMWELFMTAGVYFTLFFEIGYAFLIWRPRFRWLFLGMALVLHGGIGFFMGLQTFSLMMLTMNMAFLPPELVRQWVSRLRRKPAAETPKVPAAPPADRTPVAAVPTGKANPVRPGKAPVKPKK